MKNGSKKSADAGELKQHQIRMNDAMDGRIRAYQKRLETERPDLPVTFSIAARSLIDRGLTLADLPSIADLLEAYDSKRLTERALVQALRKLVRSGATAS